MFTHLFHDLLSALVRSIIPKTLSMLQFNKQILKRISKQRIQNVEHRNTQNENQKKIKLVRYSTSTESTIGRRFQCRFWVCVKCVVRLPFGGSVECLHISFNVLCELACWRILQPKPNTKHNTEILWTSRQWTLANAIRTVLYSRYLHTTIKYKSILFVYICMPHTIVSRLKWESISYAKMKYVGFCLTFNTVRTFVDFVFERETDHKLASSLWDFILPTPFDGYSSGQLMRLFAQCFFFLLAILSFRLDLEQLRSSILWGAHQLWNWMKCSDIAQFTIHRKKHSNRFTW